MDNYVQYHNSEAMGVSCLELTNGEENSFSIATSKPVSKLIGSQIWLIGGLGKPRKYYLCYYFLVDNIEPSDSDSYFKYYVTGQEGKVFKPAVLLNDFEWFKDFLKSQQNFSMGLRKIDKVFVDELEKIAFGNIVPNSILDEQVKKIGSGFGDSETNRQIEQAAVLFAKNYYEQNHWLVESVESEKCGYDLLCTKGSNQEHVEVKGIQGSLVSFVITSGEVKQSKSNKYFVLCAVTSVLSTPTLHRFSASEFREKFTLDPISYRASLKQD